MFCDGGDEVFRPVTCVRRDDESRVRLTALDGRVDSAGREQLRARVADFFREVDALLMPVAVVSAIAHNHDKPLARRKIHTDGGARPYLDMFGWAGLATVAYLPATVVPVGRTPSGLPVGIQIVGPHLEDRTTLAAARCVEELLGGFVPPPGC